MKPINFMPLIKVKNPFGLDISDRVLRLIQLRKKGKKNIIIAKNEIRLPKGIITDGEIKNSDEFVKALKKLISTTAGRKIVDRQVISVLPEKKTFIKVIKIKADAENKIKESLAAEIPNHIPLDIDDIIYDWQLIGDFVANKPVSVLIGVCPKNIVTEYLEALKKAHLTTLALEVEAVSITRCLIDEKTEKVPKIIIDMGAARTSLILVNHGLVQFSVSLPVAGNDITKKISETLEIDWKKAEKAKLACGLDDEKCRGALKKILISPINKIVGKTKEVIDFYQEHSRSKEPISEIIITGGGANLINIDKVLFERLNIPIIAGNPFKKIAAVDSSLVLGITAAQSYSTAIGLALRALQKNHIV